MATVVPSQTGHAWGAREKRRSLIAAFASVFVMVPLTWMATDRDLPFRRTGEIEAADPVHCGLSEGSADAIEPGGCVRLTLHMTTIRPCRRSAAENVSRSIVDSAGVRRDVGVLASTYSGERDATITRFFILPPTIARGPAIYRASACFTCNPLQYALSWPVCVDKPDITFEVR